MSRPRGACVLAGIVALAAGCGSSSPSPAGDSGLARDHVTVVVAPGTHRFDPAKLRPGDTVRCREGAAGAQVPSAGHGVSGTGDGATESSSITVDNRGDVIIVSCEAG